MHSSTARNAAVPHATHVQRHVQRMRMRVSDPACACCTSWCADTTRGEADAYRQLAEAKVKEMEDDIAELQADLKQRDEV